MVRGKGPKARMEAVTRTVVVPGDRTSRSPNVEVARRVRGQEEGKFRRESVTEVPAVRIISGRKASKQPLTL